MRNVAETEKVEIKHVPFSDAGTLKVRFLPPTPMEPRKIALCSLLFFLLFLPAFAGDQADVTLYFSPRGGCEAAIVKAIDTAKLDISVAAYSFSSKPIGLALYRALKRGIIVRILLDKRQPTAHYSMANELTTKGLIVRIDKRESSMHMKTMIVDGKLLIMGSYNFTASAENKNAEIICFIEGQTLVDKAAINWYKHWRHSQPHKLKAKKKPPGTAKAEDPACDNESCPVRPSTSIFYQRTRRPKRWSN